MASENTSGSGMLTCPGHAPVKVRYEFDVDWDGDVVMSVRGTVTGRSGLHLQASQSHLDLSDGRQVPVVFGGSYNRVTRTYAVRWPPDERSGG
jgi:hypothetical protein